MIIHRDQEAVVHGDDLKNIYIDPLDTDTIICPMCGQQAECNTDLWCVSIGNQVVGYFYCVQDAEDFSEILARRTA